MSEILIGEERVDFRLSLRAVITDPKDDRFLLLQHRNGLLIFPGGRVEEHEIQNYLADCDETATLMKLYWLLDGYPLNSPLYRELTEELGFGDNELNIFKSLPHKALGYVTWFKRSKSPDKATVRGTDVLHAYFLKNKDELKIKVDGTEIIGHVWLNPLEMLPYLDSIPTNTRLALHAFGQQMWDNPLNVEKFYEDVQID